jgi:beta-galactosidase/beta-glucuronidase
MFRMPKIWTVSLGLLALTLCGCAPKAARLYRDFDFDWKFIKADPAGAQAVEFDDSSWRDVNIPHDWSIEGPYSDQWASGTGYLPGGIGWYRKTFRLDSALQSKRIAIEFDGIYNNSEVWLNGQFLGKRPFGYISFQYDLTPHLRFGSIENVLAVRVDHSEFADSRWYTGSGIYRHTRLCITDPICIDYCGTFVTTPTVNEQLAAVQVQTALTNSSTSDQTLTLTLTVENPDPAERAFQSRAIPCRRTEPNPQPGTVGQKSRPLVARKSRHVHPAQHRHSQWTDYRPHHNPLWHPNLPL